MPVKPVPAASIMLLRDGRMHDDGLGRLEVLMIERHGKLRFAGGALVFPGGKVDHGDRYPGLLKGHDNLGYLPFRLAAVRELFEEAGVLLAARQGTRQPVGKSGQIILSRCYRHRFLHGQCSLNDLRREAGLRYSPDRLVPFARWITPDGQPLRYDTLFFLAPLPRGQVALHDGGEAVRSFWARPLDLLADLSADLSGGPVAAPGAPTKKLMFPTRMNLARLARAKTVLEALDNARKSKVVAVMPRVVKTATGTIAYIPAEAGYGGTEFPF